MTREPDPIAVERLIAGDRPARVRKADIDEAIRQLAAWGLNDREIAERIRSTHDAVTQRRRRAGIPSPTVYAGRTYWPTEQRLERRRIALTMAANGHSQAAIARRLGITRGGAQSLIQRCQRSEDHPGDLDGAA